MIKIACISYNNLIINNFNNPRFSISYCDSCKKANEDSYDVIIILNDKGNVDLIKCLKLLKNIDNTNIYLIDNKYNDYILKKAFSFNICDYLVLPININYFILKIINDFESNNIVTNFRYKELYIDYYSNSVFINESEIILTRLEYKLLRLLIENVNTPVNKKDINEKVWGYHNIDYRTVVSHIKSLRKKLMNYRRCIVTINGVGYGFFI